MIRNVSQDLFQIGNCVAGQSGYEAVRVYVILNEGHPILIDCGSHLYRVELMQELETLLGTTTPEYIFLTHSELPHSGNLQKIAARSDLFDDIHRQMIRIDCKSLKVSFDHGDNFIGEDNHIWRGNKTLTEIAAVVNQVGAVKGSTQQCKRILSPRLQIRKLRITATGGSPDRQAVMVK